MKSITYASALFLLGAALAVMADPASACPPPPSGTGVTTCSGDASVPGPSTSGGPVCFNTLCPGVSSETTDGRCVSVWLDGTSPSDVPLCYPFSRGD